MQDIILERYIETKHFWLFNSDNNTPISVGDFTTAFSMNKHYNSGVPLARDGLQDIFLILKDQKDIRYPSEFVDRIIEQDRYLVTDRVAFFSLMRTVLPTFYLITNDDKEIKVEPFATMGENGQCSVSYVYNLNEKFDKNINALLYTWSDVKYIKLDKTLFEILQLKRENEDEIADFFCVELEELFSVLGTQNKFKLGIEVLGRILNEGGGDCDISYTISSMVYRYYQTRCDYDDIDDLLKRIRGISQGLPDDYNFNPEINDVGKDISVQKNILTYGYNNMMIEVRKNKCKVVNFSFETLYTLFDYFLMQKEKIYRFISKYKNDELNELSEEELIALKSEIYREIKDDLLYDFFGERYFTARAVYECLNMKLHINQLERILDRIDKTLIQMERLQKAQREKDEAERKEIEEGENKKREDSVNKRLQLVSMLFSVPVVSDLVEVFYAEDLPNWISFPKGWAKLIWIVITALLVNCLFTKFNSNPKKNKHD